MGRLTRTVSGNVASFRSADKANIESLKIHFLPQQEGSGDPSPSNVRPITGWIGCNLFRCKSIWDGKTEQGLLDSSGAEQSRNTNLRNVGYIPVEPNRSIMIQYIQTQKSAANIRIYRYGSDYSYISDSWVNPGIITVSNSTYYIRFYMDTAFSSAYSTNKNLVIDYAENVENILVSWSDHGAEYGGYVDLAKGKLIATYQYVIADGSADETWNKTSMETVYRYVSTLSSLGGSRAKNSSTANLRTNYFISNASQIEWYAFIGSTGNFLVYVPLSIDSTNAWREYLAEHNLQICYELDEPVEYDLTSQQIKTFLDRNNFWSDTNSVTEVEYDVIDHLAKHKFAMNTPHIETKTGIVASFNTDVRTHVKECRIAFLPVQNGSGDPSPSNIRPITGWNGLKVYKEGKNLIDKNALTGTDSVWWKGSVVLGYPEHCVTPLIPVKPGATYYLYRRSVNSSNQSGQGYVNYFGKDKKTYMGQENWQDAGVGNPHVIPDGVYYIGITVGTNYKDTAYLQFIGQETSYTDYVEGETIPVVFPEMRNLWSAEESYTFTQVQNVYLDPPLPAGSYVFSCEAVSTDSDSNKCMVYFYGDDSPIVSKTFDRNKRSYVKITTSSVIDRFILYASDSYQASSGDTATFSNIMIEKGTVESPYEPYRTMFGGYVDLVNGKLVAEYELLTATWGDWGTASDQGDGTTLRYKRFTHPVYGNGITNHNTDYCNVAKYVYANENGNTHYYIVGNSYNCRVYLPNDFPTDQIIQVVGKLITPIEYSLTSQQIKVLKGANNFWSDANNNITVKYWTH